MLAYAATSSPSGKWQNVVTLAHLRNECVSESPRRAPCGSLYGTLPRASRHGQRIGKPTTLSMCVNPASYRRHAALRSPLYCLRCTSTPPHSPSWHTHLKCYTLQIFVRIGSEHKEEGERRLLPRALSAASPGPLCRARRVWGEFAPPTSHTLCSEPWTTLLRSPRSG